MTSKSTSDFVTKIIIFYFSIAIVAVFAEVFSYKPLIVLSRIVLPIILMLLYYLKSQKKDILFYIIIILFLITNILFIVENSQLFLYGIIIFMFHRIFAIYLILKLNPKNNYLLILLATFPFLLIFFCLIYEINEGSTLNFNILIVQSILISILGGVSLSNYIKDDNRQNSWLLISTLLFIGLRFIVFVEKYYLPNDELNVFRPMETLLTVFGFFTFYKFVIAAENNNVDLIKSLKEDAK